MKITQAISFFMVIFSVTLLSGCGNTFNGMHQDWRNDTQSVANSVNNS